MKQHSEFILALIMVAVLIAAPVFAERLTLSGPLQGTGYLGNTVAANTGVKVTTADASTVSCQLSVVNGSSAIIANAATVNIETSSDNSHWYVAQTVSIVASTVGAFYNATFPMFTHLRSNVTAIDLADSTEFALVICHVK